jgi:cytochrome c1
VKIFEEFAKDTPLEKVVGPVDVRVESQHGAEKKIPDIVQGGIPEVQRLQDEYAEDKVENLEAIPGLVEEQVTSDTSDSGSDKNEKENEEDENKKVDEDSESVEENEDTQDDEEKSQADAAEESENKVDDDEASETSERSAENDDEVKSASHNANENSVKTRPFKSGDDEPEMGEKIKEAGHEMKEMIKEPFTDSDKLSAEESQDKYKDIAETMAYPFEPVDAIETYVKMNDPVYSDIRRNVYVESSTDLDEYVNQVVQYLESWKKLNNTRIKAGLYEFNEMSEKLDHYQKKTEGLNGSKNKDKYERNQQKLLGILESHTSYSEKLLRYIEEATERGWKDFYPLLLNAMEFDLSYAAGQYKYCSHMTTVIDNLKKSGEEYGLQQHGRLQELESEPLGGVYTGERTKPKPSYLVGYPGGKSISTGS